MARAEGGSVPSGVGFWRILKSTKRPFCTCKIKSEGTICISVPLLQIIIIIIIKSERHDNVIV